MMKQYVECTIPILPVRNMRKSMTFFTETLGFQLDWGDASSTVCSVSRDGKPIMLRELAGDFAPAWVWIGLEDDSLMKGLDNPIYSWHRRRLADTRFDFYED